MDPYNLYGRAQYSSGTSGSESSWTRYIGSEGIQQANDCAYVGGYTGKQGHRRGSYNGFGDEYCESDDSMASDASSGPSTHYELPSGSRNEGSLEVGCSSSYSLKHTTTTTKRSSKENQKVGNKQMKQKEEGGRVDVERQELVVHQARSSKNINATSTNGKRGVKVRKSK